MSSNSSTFDHLFFSPELMSGTLFAPPNQRKRGEALLDSMSSSDLKKADSLSLRLGIMLRMQLGSSSAGVPASADRSLAVDKSLLQCGLRSTFPFLIYLRITHET